MAAGLTTVKSYFGSGETMDQLVTAVEAAGLTVFARIDHTAGAEAVGLSLRPTALLIFGNAKAGTILMQAEQRVGIDLPIKALVYQDENGQVWIAYNEPGWFVGRHGVADAVAPTVKAMAAVLKLVVETATQ